MIHSSPRRRGSEIADNESAENPSKEITPSEHLRLLMLEREKQGKSQLDASENKVDTSISTLNSDASIADVSSQRKAADDKRRKREMFLNEVDNFSANFSLPVTNLPSGEQADKELLSPMVQTSQQFVVKIESSNGCAAEKTSDEVSPVEARENFSGFSLIHL